MVVCIGKVRVVSHNDVHHIDAGVTKLPQTSTWLSTLEIRSPIPSEFNSKSYTVAYIWKMCSQYKLRLRRGLLDVEINEKYWEVLIYHKGQL